MPWQTWSWVGPKSAHGVLIEVAAPYESHDDGKWHHAPGKFAYKGAGGTPPLRRSCRKKHPALLSA